MSKSYTWDEIRKHNRPGDLWLVIKGKVYDVSAFASEHPGGEDLLLEQAGKDATEPFDEIGHSPDAIDERQKHIIGLLA